MSSFQFVSSRLIFAGLALALCLVACKKKPAPEPPPAPEQPAAPAPAPAETAAAPAPPQPADVAATPEFEKMTPEDKYWGEMADSITSFIQDHLRNKGRMPRDAKDIVDLKIMSRVDVPPNYVLLIDQKTGRASLKKIKK